MATAEFDAAVSRYTTEEIRQATHHLKEHPLRGTVTSHDAAHGRDPHPSTPPALSSVRTSELGGEVAFRFGDAAGWEQLTMAAAGWSGFKAALLDNLVKQSGVRD